MTSEREQEVVSTHSQSETSQQLPSLIVKGKQSPGISGTFLPDYSSCCLLCVSWACR